MIVSENQAKSMWCPEVRVHDASKGVGINAYATPSPDGMTLDIVRMGNCIGSDCMMWRWSGVQSDGEGFCGKGRLA